MRFGLWQGQAQVSVLATPHDLDVAVAKRLLAVEVAAALPVVAQAQVTLSGRIDTAVVNSKSATNGISATGMASGTLTTNQIVLQGSEDMTGGMKANFIINSQYATDEKAALDFGHRGILVGLSGGFGAVDLGRSTCTTLCVLQASGLIGNLGNMTGSKATARPENSVTYTTPSMSGLRLKVIHGLNEGKNATVPTGKEITEIAALYAEGPLDVMVAYLDEKGSATQYLEQGFTPTTANGVIAAPTAVGPGKHKGLRVNYNAGFATFHVRWQEANVVAALGDITEYGLGAAIPLSGGRSALIDYRVSDPENNKDATRISAAFVQELSKRTNVYGAIWSDNYSGANTSKDGTAFEIGVRHSF
jgi:predicted porin